MSRSPLVLLLVLISLCGLACGGTRESGSAASPDSLSGSKPSSEVGRYKIEVVRLSVPEPLFVRVDTATGEVTQHKMLGKGLLFQPVAEETPPGANQVQVGRFRVRVVPGRRGAALMRLDTSTGRVWLLHLNIKPRRWEEMGDLQQAAAGSTRDPNAESTHITPTTIPKFEALVGLLGSRKNPSDVRGIAATLLVLHYSDKAASPLLSALEQEEDPKVLLAIVEALDGTGDARLPDALGPLRSHSDSKIANAARQALEALER